MKCGYKICRSIRKCGRHLFRFNLSLNKHIYSGQNLLKNKHKRNGSTKLRIIAPIKYDGNIEDEIKNIFSFKKFMELNKIKNQNKRVTRSNSYKIKIKNKVALNLHKIKFGLTQQQIRDDLEILLNNEYKLDNNINVYGHTSYEDTLKSKSVSLNNTLIPKLTVKQPKTGFLNDVKKNLYNIPNYKKRNKRHHNNNQNRIHS